MKRASFWHGEQARRSQARAIAADPIDTSKSGRATVVGHASATVIATVLNVAMLNAAGILIVRMIGVQGRGEVAAAVLVPTIIAYAGWFGLPSATGFLINSSPSERRRSITTARTLGLALSVILSAICLFLSTQHPLDSSVRLASIIYSSFIPLNLFRYIHEAVLQADLRIVSLNAIRVTGAAVYLFALLGLLVTDRATVELVILSQLLANLAWCVLLAWQTRADPWVGFDVATAKSLLHYGARSHIASMSPVDGLRLDQLILGLFLTTYDLGLYAVAMTFVTANRTIGVSLGLIAFPYASTRSPSVAAKRRQILVGLVVAALVLTAAVAGFEVVVGRELLQLFFEVADDTAYTLLWIGGIGSVFMCGRQVLINVLAGMGYPGLGSLSELISALSLIGCAVVLWRYAVVGIAWSLTTSAVIAFMFLVVAARWKTSREPGGG